LLYTGGQSDLSHWMLEV